MLARVLLPILTGVLLLAGSTDVIRAQENLPDGVFAFTSSYDELIWQRGPYFETTTIYIGENGYSVALFRMPPNTADGSHSNQRPNSNTVVRVLSGTLHLALSDDLSGLTRADAKAYGPGSLIVHPFGVMWRWFTGDDGVTFELTNVRNIARRSSE